MVRSRGDKEDVEKLVPNGKKNNISNRIVTSSISNVKEASCKIVRLMVCLFIFVLGVIIGLTSSSHVDKYMSSRPAVLFSDNHAVVIGGPMSNSLDSNCSIIRCEKEDCFSLENYVHPKELLHCLSDHELFWKASLVPKIEEYPFRRVPKVAFMFLTRGPLPLLQLWERFFGGHEERFSIYVHTEPGYILNVPPESVFYGRQIPSQTHFLTEVTWGSISLVDAEKRLLANALLDFSNERFVLLSESCIPVYNFPIVYKYLTESVHTFVESYDDPSRYGRGRYHRRMAPTIELKQWRKGSQWFEINRDMAIEILSDYKHYYLFKKYCHPSCFSDEHYLPTYLNIFHPTLNSNRTLTWVDWSLGGPHPATFGKENITEGFLQNMRNNGTECVYNSQKTTVCYLFARKFAPSALEPLLELSSKVMEY